MESSRIFRATNGSNHVYPSGYRGPRHVVTMVHILLSVAQMGDAKRGGQGIRKRDRSILLFGVTIVSWQTAARIPLYDTAIRGVA